MGKSKKFRAAISLALTLAVASVFALSSLAASNSREAASAGRLDDLSSAPAGKLMGTGHFTIDGEEAQPGASVLSGSTIATGSDGNAVIDLGSLGRIELRPNTTIKVAFAGNSVSVSLDHAGSMAQSLPTGVAGQLILLGEHARLSVVRGEVEVNSAGNARTLHTGEQSTFNNPAEVITTGDAVLVADRSSADKHEDDAAPSHGKYVSGGTAGVIAMAGVATAVTIGVIAGSGNNRSSNPLTPRPSRVVP